MFPCVFWSARVPGSPRRAPLHTPPIQAPSCKGALSHPRHRLPCPPEIVPRDLITITGNR
ncbi:MAG: hypothetical protein ACW980_23605 [Promethearchaeota archaeon]